MPLACVTVVEASPEALAVSADRKFCAVPESWPSAACVEDSRDDDQRVGIDDAVQPVEIAREGDRLRGARAERQADIGDLAGRRLPSAL